ncbi:MAG: OmpA family protein, partial [Gammaproteobacteria bacterium]|nr:OmpA family protein [Gammaproteobacteria bacterium]
PAPAPAPAPVDGDADNDGVPDSRDKCPNTKAGAKVDENGCEGKKATLETIRLNVQFPTNSDRIDPSYDAEIRKVADFLKRFPDSTVEIEGHTDSTGGRALNMDLSQRRANSVMNRLVQVHGVNPDRVTAVGYGPDRPVASNDTPAGRQQNRRVDARMEQIVE